MNEAQSRRERKLGRVRVASLSQLDALVGEIVVGNPPEVAWQDSFGIFRFPSRAEAEEAITNNYYRLFRPDLDWELATVEEIRRFPPYSSNLEVAWGVVEFLGDETGQTEIRREGDFWRASFSNTEAFAATPALAICLAALRTRGIDPVFCENLLEEGPASRVDTPYHAALPVEDCL